MTQMMGFWTLTIPMLYVSIFCIETLSLACFQQWDPLIVNPEKMDHGEETDYLAESFEPVETPPQQHPDMSKSHWPPITTDSKKAIYERINVHDLDVLYLMILTIRAALSPAQYSIRAAQAQASHLQANVAAVGFWRTSITSETTSFFQGSTRL